jgi:hypothetical protein
MLFNMEISEEKIMRAKFTPRNNLTNSVVAELKLTTKIDSEKDFLKAAYQHKIVFFDSALFKNKRDNSITLIVRYCENKATEPKQRSMAELADELGL